MYKKDWESFQAGFIAAQNCWNEKVSIKEKWLLLPDKLISNAWFKWAKKKQERTSFKPMYELIPFLGSFEILNQKSKIHRYNTIQVLFWTLYQLICLYLFIILLRLIC